MGVIRGFWKRDGVFFTVLVDLAVGGDCVVFVVGVMSSVGVLVEWLWWEVEEVMAECVLDAVGIAAYGIGILFAFVV